VGDALKETKMIHSVSHLALVIPELRAAEGYYQSLFDMNLIGREAEMDDGLWYTLSFDKSWEDAEGAGITLGMAALRKGGLVLALFRGEKPPGQVFVIGLHMPEEVIAAVRSRLPSDTVINEDETGRLEFIDPYQITWQITTGAEFRTAGDYADRWIEV
jgi:catechol 2,3-dioxygenase-like lactoylglutathione lyase family enzyme